MTTYFEVFHIAENDTMQEFYSGSNLVPFPIIEVQEIVEIDGVAYTVISRTQRRGRTDWLADSDEITVNYLLEKLIYE